MEPTGATLARDRARALVTAVGVVYCLTLLVAGPAAATSPIRLDPADKDRWIERVPYEMPFASRAEWLEFMSQGGSFDTGALSAAYPEEEFAGFLDGTLATVERVTFRSGGLVLRGVLVSPTGDGPFPGVVYARGGNREYGRLRFLDVARMFAIARGGRVVLAPEYRGEGGSEGDPELGAGDVSDLRSAAAALGALELVDSELMDVVGLSRGGLVAAWALEPPTPFRSAILIAADLDLADTAARRPEMDSAVYRLSVPGYSTDRETALRTRSPVHATDRLADVPILLLHAADDPRVHPSASLEFAQRWTEAGRLARVLLFEDGGHALLSRSRAVRAEIESWLNRQTSGITAPSPTRGNLLVPRYGLSAATDGRWVYVYGGAPSGSRNGPDFMHQGLLSSIERVDPASLESTYFSNGLHRRANHGSVAVWDSLVSCGGRTQIGLVRSRVSSCEVLDLEDGTFRELPPLPEPLRTLGIAEVEGDLYAVGGFTEEGSFSNATLRLARGESVWEELEDLPVPREGEIVSVNRRLYAIGGYNGAAMRSVLVFDTEQGAWEQLRDLPYPLSAFSAVSDGEAVFLFGDYERMSAVHRYDPAEESLHLLDLEITPRRHSDAVAVDGRVLVIGGNRASSGPATTLIESFELEELRNAPPRESLDEPQIGDPR